MSRSKQAELFAMFTEGRRLDVNAAFNTQNTGQCVNPANLFAVAHNVPASAGNARDIHYPEAELIVKPDVDPHLELRGGDIVVWTGPPALAAGHIAVALHHRSVAGFWALSEDWPIGTPCHRQWFSWDGVSHWYRLP